MDLVAVIKKRKSVRKFQPKAVEEEKIQQILELVNLAPSAGNLQAYKIFVVKDKHKVKQICQTTGGIQRNFENYPAIILIFCADQPQSARRYLDRGRNLYSIQDATIACAYAQLIATDLGLASCWVGSFDEDEIRKIIGTNLLPIALLPVGYADEDPPHRPRKSLSEISEILSRGPTKP